MRLAGFDIKLYKKDFELAQQIQWNQIPNPFDPGVFQNDYVPGSSSFPVSWSAPLWGSDDSGR